MNRFTPAVSPALLAVALACVTMLAACGSKEEATAPAADATTPAKTTVAVPDACKLLTIDEVKEVTGWVNPASQDVTVDRSYQTSCNFAESTDPSHYVSVTASVGGMTHADSAAYATSVGDNGGMLSEPAKAVDGFPVPVIEMTMGATHGMQARTPNAVELTVNSPSAETTRALFTKAVARL